MCFELKTDNPDFCKALYIEAQMFAEKPREAEAKVIMIAPRRFAFLSS